MQTEISELAHRRNIEQAILHSIVEERRHQESKWGIQEHSDDRWLAILTEEVGELAKAINDLNTRNQSIYDPAGVEQYASLVEELIQVAAVAVAHLEDISYYLETQGPEALAKEEETA